MWCNIHRQFVMQRDYVAELTDVNDWKNKFRPKIFKQYLLSSYLLQLHYTVYLEIMYR